MWKVIRWPLIYFVIQFLLIVIMAYFYIQGGNAIDEFNSFLLDKQLLIVVILGLIFIPLLLIDYKKNYYNSEVKKINIPILLIIVVLLSLVYNVFAYYVNNFTFQTSLFDSNGNILYVLLSTGLIGPVIEELMFRGIIYNELKKRITSMAAILITTLFFALTHFNIFQIIYALALGFILIFVYEKYKDIKAPIILHMASNITTTLFVPLLIKDNFIVNYSIFLIGLIGIFLIKKYTKFFKI